MEYGPRHREFSVSKTTPSGYDRYINGVKYDSAKYPDIVWDLHENQMDDVVTENFREKVKRGEIINNPCVKEDVFTYYTNTNWSYGTDDMSYYFQLFGSKGYLDYILNLPGDPNVSNAVNLAVTRARAKCTSEVIQIGATLGELKETKDMFVSAAARLRHAGTLAHRYLDIISDPRKNCWDRAGKLVGTARNAWMEFRFGWRPFAGEAQNFYSALQGLSEYPERQTFRAGENLQFSDADTTSKYLSPTQTWNFSRTVYETHVIRSGVLCEQRYGGVPDTWGVTKIPQTVWELTRLSWAVDYFLNIGDLIAAYTPDSLWTPKASWVTIRSKTVSVVTQTGLTSTGWKQYGPGPSRIQKTFVYSRSPDPTPHIAVKSIVDDAAKLLDIASLTRIDAKKWLNRASNLASTLKRKV